jgi:pantoate--beta-alanine ligase
MTVFSTIDEIRAFVSSEKADGKSIAFVPTMGALHEGHFSLVRQAYEHADQVIVSIFVNPTQFAPHEDLEKYPRTPENDLEACENLGVAAVFMPSAEDMYPPKTFISFSIYTITDYLCGASREGHFEGVLQIVCKLFNIVQPDVAVFGQKDIQQLTVIKRMVKELNFPISIIGAETVREPDGLAKSSRNKYLNEEERAIAPELYKALKKIIHRYSNEEMEINQLLSDEKNRLSNIGFNIDYLSVNQADNLQPVSDLSSHTEYVVAGAVFLGSTRLIDNIIFNTTN